MLWMLVSAALAQQGPDSPPQTPPPQAIAEAALADSLEAAMLRFFHDWHRVWRASEMNRHPIVGQLDARLMGTPLRRDGNNAVTTTVDNDAQVFERVRHENLACLPDARNLWVKPHAIVSRAGAHGVCPTWMMGTLEATDERVTIDGGIGEEYREAVNVARLSLADAFAGASATFPRNDWFVGQTVRLLVDARRLPAAQSVAEKCAATRWWCEVLRGYTLHARTETVAAEAAFQSALTNMPADVRCRWTDASVLLDSAGRAEYGSASCAQRDSVTRWLWWLADPLYSVPGNARLAEHFARQTLVALRSALDRDERYDWRPALGGDALTQMIIRYGWPSYTFWGGEHYERGINDNLADDPTAFRKTRTTFEYTAGRTHLVPSWNAVQSPLSASAADWVLRDPSAPDDPDKSKWWPQEHWSTPIAQLPGPQVAMLRRQTNVIVASAVDLDTALNRRTGGEWTAGAMLGGVMLTTDRPDSFETVDRRSAQAGRTLVLRGTAEQRRALLGIELAGDSSRGIAAARTRFAVNPPTTLASMIAGEVAVSEPVVLRAESADAEMPLDADSALGRMRGSTRIVKGGKIGVYWESYGFRPSDSVTVAVWIERYTPQGLVRQLGIAFKVATDLNTPVATSWDEVAANSRARVIAGPVPIVGRSVVLDVSALPAGDYWLEVAVGKRGEQPVRSRRTLTIQ